MKTYLIVLLGLCPFFFFGQEEIKNQLIDIVPPSPMAAELSRYHHQMPDLYTGTAKIKVPLYTLNFDGWELPLSIDYAATGIHTNQEASEIGLGWGLNTTALITRQVRKNNDLRNTLSSTGYPFQESEQLGLVERYYYLDEGIRAHIQESLLIPNLLDTEPDLFSYNFFGFSGRFSLGRHTNNQINTVHHTPNGVNIAFDLQNKSFILTTPTGFKGYFTLKERSTNLTGLAPSNGTEPDYNQLVYGSEHIDIQSIINRGNFRTITAWYISKIESPKGKEIHFRYNVNENEDSPHLSISRPLINEKRFVNDPVYFSRQLNEHIYQTSIEIPNELKIDFHMEDRADVEKNYVFLELFPAYDGQQEPQRYTGMTIRGLDQASTLERTIEFKQSYFNLAALHQNEYPNQRFQKLRGRLDEVAIDDQVYQFLYENGPKGLPLKSTKAMDHFGYYNGNDSNQLLMGVSRNIAWFGNVLEANISYSNPSTGEYFEGSREELLDKRYSYFHSNRSSQLEFAKSGVLKKMILPTKGSIEYEYESHSYRVKGGSIHSEKNEFPQAVNEAGNGGIVSAGGLRIKSISAYDKDETLASKKTYIYASTTQASTGILIHPFLAVFLNSDLPNNFYENYIQPQDNPILYKIFEPSKSLVGLSSTNGRKIGYSHVEERTENKNGSSFRQVFDFHNEAISFSNSTLNNTSDSFMNGKTTHSSQYDSFKRVQSQDNKYNTSFQPLASYIRYDFTSRVPIFIHYQSPVNNGELMEQSTAHYYGYSAVENVTQVHRYKYNELKQRIESFTQLSSSKEELKVVHKHLLDYSSTGCVSAKTGECLQDFMRLKNLWNPLLEKITYKGTTVLAATAYRYDIEHNQLVLKEILSYDRSNGRFNGSTNGFEFGTSYVSEMVFEKYNEEGRLLQAKDKGGKLTAYLWGHNGNYPIVVGEGISYTDLKTAHLAALNTTDYEGEIRQHSLTEKALISTHQYNPRVGKIKITAPNGISTHYEYDAFSRLKTVRDKDLKRLEEYHYHYAQ